MMFRILIVNYFKLMETGKSHKLYPGKPHICILPISLKSGQNTRTIQFIHNLTLFKFLFKCIQTPLPTNNKSISAHFEFNVLQTRAARYQITATSYYETSPQYEPGGLTYTGVKSHI